MQQPLSKDLLKYFQQLPLDTDTFTSDAAVNVLRDIAGSEVALALHRGTSGAFEQLLRLSSPEQVLALLTSLKGSFSVLLLDASGSHVMETALNRIGDTGPSAEAVEIVVDLCKELKPQLLNMLQNTYGSHGVRRIVDLLVGRRQVPSDPRQSGPDAAEMPHRGRAPIRTVAAFEPPAAFTHALFSLLEPLLSAPEDTESPPLAGMAVHASAAPALQHILVTLHDLGPSFSAKLQPLIDGLCRSLLSFQPSERQGLEHPVADLAYDNTGSHLIQAVLRVASAPLFYELYTHVFRNHLLDFCKDYKANYTVQSLLEFARDAVQAKMMVSELLPHLVALLSHQRAGVVAKLCGAAAKWKVCQRETSTAVAAACTNEDVVASKSVPPELQSIKQDTMSAPQLTLFRLLLPEKGRSSYQAPGSIPFSPLCAFIVQSLFEFEPQVSQQYHSAFSQLPAEILFALAKDRAASHIFQLFLQLPTVQQKTKKSAIAKMKGQFVELALDKSGSHIVEQCFAAADINQKEHIAKELLPQYNRLCTTLYGKLVTIKCKLDQFKRERKDWAAALEHNEKKKEMFAEFLPPHTAKNPNPSKPVAPAAATQDVIDQLFDDKKSKKVLGKATEEPKEKKKKREREETGPEPDVEAPPAKKAKRTASAAAAAPAEDFIPLGPAKAPAKPNQEVAEVEKQKKKKRKHEEAASKPPRQESQAPDSGEPDLAFVLSSIANTKRKKPKKEKGAKEVSSDPATLKSKQKKNFVFS
eukprot:TRINITY_DN4980_c0_g1_i1.p1 TRINITY_DN4980_c0_g1~~TRINITY_DN4980_c0_g1_i1.p1  ORF type:complete len:761 (-),score=212.89 TRINITY_DN4980_c0_g1_i1:12-2273(-)